MKKFSSFLFVMFFFLHPSWNLLLYYKPQKCWSHQSKVLSCACCFFNTYASMIYECMFNIHKFLSGSLSKNNASLTYQNDKAMKLIYYIIYVLRICSYHKIMLTIKYFNLHWLFSQRNVLTFSWIEFFSKCTHTGNHVE